MSLTPKAKSKKVSPETEAKFKEFLKSNGIFHQVLEIMVCDSGLQDENWASTTEYVTVKFENSRNKPLQLFVKKKLDNDGYSKLLEEWQVFQKETEFYMKYLPIARDYCKKFGHEEFMDIYAKCYYGDDKQIVMENLASGKDFVVLNKEERQDFDTARLALGNLAKHHAISYALIHDFGGPHAFFQRFPKLNFDRFITQSTIAQLCANFDNGVDICVKILQNCGVEGSEDAIKKLKSLKGKQVNNIFESVSTDTKSVPCLVLNHGDYWNCNMMFHKEKVTNKPTTHIAVDFQMIQYASPCFDLAYYVFTSVKPEVRREKLLELLNIYFDSLKHAGVQLGTPIKISLQEFQTEFCKRFYYGFWIGLGFIGFEVIKNIGANTKEGIGKLMDEMDTLLETWKHNHSEKCEETFKVLIEYVKYYEMLVNGVLYVP